MRRVVCFTALGLITGCGQTPQRSESPRPSPTTTSDSAAPTAAREGRGAGPDISPTAAPGVAFNYRYAFRLPAERIEEVQERHAAGCEALGPNRCRITGMLYRVVGDGDIEAMLSFRLDPVLARRFGRAAVQAVTRAEGQLAESEITGEDVGTGISRAGRDIAQMRVEMAEIERQLGRGDLAGDERARLEDQLRELQRAIAGTQAGREEAQDMLATTPMTMSYGSGQYAPRSGPPTLRESLARSLDGFLWGASMLLIVVVSLLPWALLVGLVWWLVVFSRRRWFAGRRKAAAGAAVPESPPPASV